MEDREKKEVLAALDANLRIHTFHGIVLPLLIMGIALVIITTVLIAINVQRMDSQSGQGSDSVAFDYKIGDSLNESAKIISWYTKDGVETRLVCTDVYIANAEDARSYFELPVWSYEISEATPSEPFVIEDMIYGSRGDAIIGVSTMQGDDGDYLIICEYCPCELFADDYEWTGPEFEQALMQRPVTFHTTEEEWKGLLES